MGSSTNNTSNTAGCFFLGENDARAEMTKEMLREMQNYSPDLLIFYCVVNLSLGLLSCIWNALVVLTIATFSELHIVSNIGLASLATVNLFHGLITNLFLLSLDVKVFVDGCPMFRSTSFPVFYFSFVLTYCSVLNLSIVTAERYIGVVLSLRYHVILPKERFVKLVAAVWIASFLLGIVFAINSLSVARIGMSFGYSHFHSR